MLHLFCHYMLLISTLGVSERPCFLIVTRIVAFPGYNHIQSTLVISTSLISKYRFSRSENLVPVLTWKSNNRYQNIMEKRRNSSLFHRSNFSSFPQYFIYLLTSGVKLHIHLLNMVRIIVFVNSANLICRRTDISKYSRESLRLRDNESRLYIKKRRRDSSVDSEVCLD